MNGALDHIDAADTRVGLHCHVSKCPACHNNIDTVITSVFLLSQDIRALMFLPSQLSAKAA